MKRPVKKTKQLARRVKAKPRYAKMKTHRSHPKEQTADEAIAVAKERREAVNDLGDVCDALRAISPEDGKLMTSSDRFKMAADNAEKFARFAERRLQSVINETAVLSAYKLTKTLRQISHLLGSANVLYGKVEGELDAYLNGIGPMGNCRKCGVRPSFVSVGTSYKILCPKCGFETFLCHSLREASEEWNVVNAVRDVKEVR